MATQEIILYTPDSEKIKIEAKSLDCSFTKDHLITEIKRIQDIFQKVKQIKYFTKRGTFTTKPPKEFENLFVTTLSKFKKQEITLILAAFTADIRNYHTEIQLWSDERRQLMFATAENGLCTQAEMDAALKIKPTGRYYSLYNPYQRIFSRYENPSPLTGWIDFNRVNSRGETIDPTGSLYGKLPVKWHLALFELLHDDLLQPFPQITDHDISNPNYTRVNLQESISPVLTYMVQAYRTEALTRGSARILSKSDLKKIKGAHLEMNPFADDTYTKLLDGYFACSFAAHFLNTASASLIPYNGTTMPDGMTILEKMFKNLEFLNNVQLYEFILPHLSGFQASITNKFGYRYYILKIKDLLKNNSQNWLDLQVLKHKVYHYAISKDAAQIMEYGVESAKLVSEITKRKITPATMNTEVMYPFIEGILMQLMSMGLVEGVFAPFEETMHSYFGGLRYVRLTEMGRAILGDGNNFTLTLTDKYAQQYDVINGPLLIYSRVPDNPNDKILSDIAVKTGRYWKVTLESFLFRCFTIEDIEYFIDIFKQSICKNPPAAWQQFFESLLHKAINRPTEEATAWRVMHIAPDNTELQQLLCTEPFRNIVVRAEGYRILVRQPDYPQFTLLMKQNGYLL